MDATEVAYRLKMMRAALGEDRVLSQLEFGLLLHKSEATIQRWEKGRGQPDPFVLASYAEALGFNRDYFIDERPTLPSAKEMVQWRRANRKELDRARKDARQVKADREARAAEREAEKAAALDAAAGDVERSVKEDKRPGSARSAKVEPSNGTH